MNLTLSKIAFILGFCAPLYGHSQEKKSSVYLNQKPPGATPQVFAPEVVSTKDSYEFGSVFSNNGKEFYYGVNVGEIAEIRCIKTSGNQWSKPFTIITSEKFSHNDPFLSPDDQKLFFISDRPVDGSTQKKDYDIWYMDRKGDGWSAPINAGSFINSEKNEYYISFSRSGSMYFSSNGRTEPFTNNYDIYSAKATGNGFEPAILLSNAINTQAYEADVFVDPNETFMIFCADRPEGFGKGDLYISFKSKDGTWIKARNMGKVINSPGHELCPYVTKDGKYFFYTSNKDIYWVSTEIFQSMR